MAAAAAATAALMGAAEGGQEKKDEAVGVAKAKAELKGQATPPPPSITRLSALLRTPTASPGASFFFSHHSALYFLFLFTGPNWVWTSDWTTGTNHYTWITDEANLSKLFISTHKISASQVSSARRPVACRSRTDMMARLLSV